MDHKYIIKKLGLDIVDINSIINVLFYLKKLKQIKKKTYLDLTPLPELNVKIIAHTDLKTLLDNFKLDGSIRPLINQSIPELLINNLNNPTIIKDFISELGIMGEFKLLRKVIETLSQLEPKKRYLKYLNFDTLIKFLQYDKSIKDLIYDEMADIDNVKNENYKKARGNETEFEDTFKYFLSRLSDLKDFKLMKKLIDEYSLLYNRINPINKDDLFYWLLDNNFVLNAYNSTDLIQKYLQLNPNYQFRDLAKFIYYGGRGLKGLEYGNYRIKILTAAIKAKSINIFNTS